jgi:hypothetical protein
MRRARPNPTWKVGPFRVEVELEPRGWVGTIWLNDEEMGSVLEATEEQALRRAIKLVDELPDRAYLDDGHEPWREPDYHPRRHYALWWGPSQEYVNAEEIVEVDIDCVNEYTWLEPEDDEPSWSMRSYCFPKGSVPRSVRLRAAVGIDVLQRWGGNERQISEADLPAPPPKTNPARKPKRGKHRARARGSLKVARRPAKRRP